MFNRSSKTLLQKPVGLPQGSNLSAVLCALHYAKCDRLPQVQALLKGLIAQRPAAARDTTAPMGKAAAAGTPTVDTAPMGSRRAVNTTVGNKESRQPPEAAPKGSLASLAIRRTLPASATLPSATAAASTAAKKGAVMEAETAANTARCSGATKVVATGREQAARAAQRMKKPAAEGRMSAVEAAPEASVASGHSVTAASKEPHHSRRRPQRGRDRESVLPSLLSNIRTAGRPPLMSLQHQFSTREVSRKSLHERSTSTRKDKVLRSQKSVRIGPLLLHFLPLSGCGTPGRNGRRKEGCIQPSLFKVSDKKTSSSRTDTGSTSQVDTAIPRCSAASLSERVAEDSGDLRARRENTDREKITKKCETDFLVLDTSVNTTSTDQGVAEQQGQVNTEEQASSSRAHKNLETPQSTLRVSAVARRYSFNCDFFDTALEIPANTGDTTVAARDTNKPLGGVASPSTFSRLAADAARSTSPLGGKHADTSFRDHVETVAAAAWHWPTTTNEAECRHAAAPSVVADTTAAASRTCDCFLRTPTAVAVRSYSCSPSNKGPLAQDTKVAAGVHVTDQTAAVAPECSTEAVTSRPDRSFSPSTREIGSPDTAAANTAAVIGATGGTPPPPAAVAAPVPDLALDSSVLPSIRTAVSSTPVARPRSPAARGAASVGTIACDAAFSSPDKHGSLGIVATECAADVVAAAACDGASLPTAVFSSTHTISAGVHSADDFHCRTKSSARKKAKRQLLRRLSRLRWRPLLMRWVDDFLFISPVLWHAKAFLRLLLQEKVWGANVNQEKLQMNFDTSDDIAEQCNTTHSGSERKSRSGTKKSSIVLYSHDTERTGGSSSTEQQQSVPSKQKNNQFSPPEDSEPPPLHNTSLENEGTSTKNKQRTCISAKEKNASDTTFTTTCLLRFSPARPIISNNAGAKRKRLQSYSTIDRDANSSNGSSSGKKRRCTLPTQAEQTLPNQIRQVYAYPAVVETHGRSEQEPAPSTCKNITPSSDKLPPSVVNLREDGLEVLPCPANDSTGTESLSFGKSGYSKRRSRCYTCSRCFQSRNLCSEEETVLPGLCCCGGSKNDIAPSCDKCRSARNRVMTCTILEREACTKILKGGRSKPCRRCCLSKSELKEDEEEERRDKKYACWAGLRLDMEVVQQEGISVMPLITRNFARLQQQQRRRRSSSSSMRKNSRMDRRIADEVKRQPLSFFRCGGSFHSLCDTQRKQKALLTSRARRESDLSKESDRRHCHSKSSPQSDKRRRNDESSGNDVNKKRRRSDASRSSTPPQSLTSQTGGYFPARIQSTVKDAVVLQRFRTRCGNFGPFMQDMLEQRLFGHLKARVCTTGIFIDTKLNSRSTILRNIYIVYKSVLLRTRCALIRINKEFAGFIQPIYLIGLCMRLLVYLLYHVRSRIGSGSLRCRRPLLELHQNSATTAARGETDRCCCGCAFVAACRKAENHPTTVAACALISTGASSAGSVPAGRNALEDICYRPDTVAVQAVSQSSFEPLAAIGDGPHTSATAICLNRQSLHESTSLSPSSPRVRRAEAASSSCSCSCSSPSSPVLASKRPVPLPRTDAAEAAGNSGEAARHRVAGGAPAARTAGVIATADPARISAASTAEEVIQIVSATASEDAVTMGNLLSTEGSRALQNTRVTLPAEGAAAAATMAAPPAGEAATVSTTIGTANERRAIDSYRLEEVAVIAADLPADKADKSLTDEISTAAFTSQRIPSTSVSRQRKACASFFWQQARLLCFTAVVSVFSLKKVTLAWRQILSGKRKSRRLTKKRRGRRQRSWWKPTAKPTTARLQSDRQQKCEQHKQQKRKKQQQPRVTRVLEDVQSHVAGSSFPRTRCFNGNGGGTGRRGNEKRAATATVEVTRSVSAAVAAGGSFCEERPSDVRSATIHLAEEAAPAAANQVILLAADGKHSTQQNVGEIQMQLQQQVETHQEMKTQPHHSALLQRPKDVQHVGHQSSDIPGQPDREQRRQQKTLPQDHFPQQSRVAAELLRVGELTHNKRTTERESPGNQQAGQCNVGESERQNSSLQQRIPTERQNLFQSTEQERPGKHNQHGEKWKEGQRKTHQALRGQQKKQLEADIWQQIRRRSRHKESVNRRNSDKERKEELKKKKSKTRGDTAASRRLHAFACCSWHFARLAFHPQLLRQQQVQRSRQKEVQPETHVRLQERLAREVRQRRHRRMQTPRLQQQQERQQLAHVQRRIHTKKRCPDGRLRDTEEDHCANLSARTCSAEDVEASEGSSKKKRTRSVSRNTIAARVTRSHDCAISHPVLQKEHVVVLPPLPAKVDAFSSNLSALAQVVASSETKVPSKQKQQCSSGEEWEQQRVEDGLTIKRHVERHLDEEYKRRASRERRRDAKGKWGNATRVKIAQRTVRYVGREETLDAGIDQSCEKGRASRDGHLEEPEANGEKQVISHSSAATKTSEVETWRQIVQKDGEGFVETSVPFSAVDGSQDVRTRSSQGKRVVERGQRGETDEKMYAIAVRESEETGGKSEGNEMVLLTVQLTAEGDPKRVSPHVEGPEENQGMPRKLQDANYGVNDRAVGGRGVSEQSADENGSETLEKDVENLNKKKRVVWQATKGKSLCVWQGDRQNENSKGENIVQCVESAKTQNISLRQIRCISAEQMVSVLCQRKCYQETAESRLVVEAKNERFAHFREEKNITNTASAQASVEGEDSEERKRNFLDIGSCACTRVQENSRLGEKMSRAAVCTVEDSNVEDCPNMLGNAEENQMKKKEHQHLHQEVDKKAGSNHVLSHNAEDRSKKCGAAEGKLRGSGTVKDSLSCSACRSRSQESTPSSLERKLWRESLQYAAAEALAFSRFIEEAELRQGEGWPPLMRVRKPRAKAKTNARPMVGKNSLQ